MVAVLEDTELFFNMLNQRYGILMFERLRNRSSIIYTGELYSAKGEHFYINIVVYKEKTVIQVFNVTFNTRVCIFQKAYNTSNDKRALSKSTSLIKFLDKILS